MTARCNRVANRARAALAWADCRADSPWVGRAYLAAVALTALAGFAG